MSEELQISASEIDLGDMLDDEQVKGELKNAVLEDFVYKVRGKLRLTKKGVDWACREYAKKGEIIKVIDHPKVVTDPEDVEYVLCTVLAQRSALADGKEVPLDTSIGSKRQWRKMKLADEDDTGNGSPGKPGEIVPNPYWFEHAVSKAQRNAKLSLMEADYLAKIVEAWLFKKTGKQVPDAAKKPPAQPKQEAKPKTPVEIAKEKAEAAKKAAQEKPTDKPALSTADTRQRLYALLSVIGFKTDEEKKAAFLQFLPEYKSSTEVPEKTLVDLIEALRKVKDGVFELAFDGEGTRIMDKQGAAKYPSKSRV